MSSMTLVQIPFSESYFQSLVKITLQRLAMEHCLVVERLTTDQREKSSPLFAGVL